MSSALPLPSPSRLRGRRPGEGQKKRKAEEELSSNPHSVKRREREAGLTDLEARIDKAKKADRSAIQSYLKKLKETAEYKDASAEEKKTLEEEKREAVKQQRIQTGRHATILEYKLGMGEAGGFFATMDDGNPAWEDVEEEDPVLAELRARQDDLDNGDVVDKIEDKELAAHGNNTIMAQAKDFHEIAWRRWKKYWKTGIRRLERKLKKYNKMSIQDFAGPVYDKETNRIYDQPQPHMLFTKRERAVFRNFSLWIGDESEKIWVDLPGPSELWADDYDLEKWGFILPASENTHASLFRRAFEIAAFEQNEPEDFSLVLPGDGELVMMEEGSGATKMVQSIYSLS